jgi:DNA polymerase-3 subunit epsilon
MNPGLFYKAATNGLPLFNEPSGDPRQPHIVQLAAMLVDLDSRSMIAGFDVIIRPAGWTIPDEVAQLHGITTERALDFGVGELVALNLLLDLWSCAYVRIGHAQAFDARIVRIAMKRHIVPNMGEGGEEFADHWKNGPALCTAKMAAPICCIPPTSESARKRGDFKTPTLAEAFAHFSSGQVAGDLHTANGALQACMAVYFGIKDHTARAAQPAAA